MTKHPAFDFLFKPQLKIIISYQKYKEFMNFLQENGKENIDYYFVEKSEKHILQMIELLQLHSTFIIKFKDNNLLLLPKLTWS